MSSAPLARASSVARRSLSLSRPVIRARDRPAARASGAMVAKCWRARISVGAISAACRPASTTCAMASRATTVLPEPTSPCSRRNMRFSPERSAEISATAFFWSPVRSKGRLAKDFRRQRAVRLLRAPLQDLHFPPHQTQGELVRQKLVDRRGARRIFRPAPGPAASGGGAAAARLAPKAFPARGAQEFVIQPFGNFGSRASAAAAALAMTRGNRPSVRP